VQVLSAGQRQHVTSVSIPVKASSRPSSGRPASGRSATKAGPREVQNRFFDDESDDEQPIEMRAPTSEEDLAQLEGAMKFITDESEQCC